MTLRHYASPEAFKQSLEQRLRTSAKSGAEFARTRPLLVFDRFLARIALVFGDAATLKGGLVLELRLDRARTTKDVDLRMVGSPDGVLAKLQEAGRRDLKFGAIRCVQFGAALGQIFLGDLRSLERFSGHSLRLLNLLPKNPHGIDRRTFGPSGT